MPHLYLPAEHNDTDLALASAVADAIDSSELFVAWTLNGGIAAAPEVKALVRPRPEPPLRNPLVEAVSEIAAAFGAFVKLLSFRHPQQPVDAHPPVRTSQSELENA